jgi:hypothetical protein
VLGPPPLPALDAHQEEGSQTPATLDQATALVLIDLQHGITAGASDQRRHRHGHYDIVFGSVSPSEASRFYTTALPRAGYTITSNSSATGSSFSGTGIWFTGHGYDGQIGALSSFHISGISFGENTVEITLSPQ